MRHVIRMNEYGTHMSESWHRCEWVMSHVWMSHGTCVDESCHTCECVMSFVWISLGTHMSESCHTYEWVLWSVWNIMTHMNRSRHMYEYVMAHIWMRHVVHSTREWVMAHVWMSHGTRVNESWHTCEWVQEDFSKTCTRCSLRKFRVLGGGPDLWSVAVPSHFVKRVIAMGKCDGIL